MSWIFIRCILSLNKWFGLNSRKLLLMKFVLLLYVHVWFDLYSYINRQEYSSLMIKNGHPCIWKTWCCTNLSAQHEEPALRNSHTGWNFVTLCISSSMHSPTLTSTPARWTGRLISNYEGVQMNLKVLLAGAYLQVDWAFSSLLSRFEEIWTVSLKIDGSDFARWFLPKWWCPSPLLLLQKSGIHLRVP